MFSLVGRSVSILALLEDYAVFKQSRYLEENLCLPQVQEQDCAISSRELYSFGNADLDLLMGLC